MSKWLSTTRRDILLLLSVPLGLLVLLAAIVYIPQALARPAHDFIYSSCETSYYCSGRMVVEENKLVYRSGVRDRVDQQPQLYYYDVSENSSRPVTLGEAHEYQLNSSSRAPDGYTLTHESSSSGFLFWDGGSSQWVLKNGLYKKSVDIGESDRYYSGRDITFVGWVQ